MEESGMLNYDTLFVWEQVWSGGRMVHTESVMFSFLFWFSFPLLPVHTKPFTLVPVLLFVLARATHPPRFVARTSSPPGRACFCSSPAGNFLSLVSTVCCLVGRCC